jgi:membrane protease YdiL (CAAX protease family)
MAFNLLFLVIMVVLGFTLSLELRYDLRTNTNNLLLTGSVMEAIAAAAAFWIMVRFADRRSLESAGIAIRGLASETTVGYLIGAAMLSTAIGIMALTGVYHVLGKSSSFNPFFALVLFLFAGAAEEIIFRGYIFQTLEARWGSRIAIIFSSLLFGLAHIGNPGSHANVWQYLAGPAFICLEAGLPLSAGYMATRRLWLPIGLHWAWNFFEGPIYGADVSGIQLTPLFHAQFRGPFILTGGLFGPEASVITLIVGAAAGLLLLRVAIRAGQWKSGAQPLPATAVSQGEDSVPPQPKDNEQQTL